MDLPPELHDSGDVAAAPDGPGREASVDRDAAVNLADTPHSCSGATACDPALTSDGPDDVPSSGPDLDAPTGTRSAPLDASDVPAEAPTVLPEASERPGAIPPVPTDALDAPTDAGPPLTDVSPPTPDRPPAAADASADWPMDAPADLADAPTVVRDTSVPDTPSVDLALDSASPGPDGQGQLCASSDDCLPPLVCNINTDGRCGVPSYTQVDVSEANTCAVVSDGTLRCWGGNDWGQLGLPANTLRSLPFALPEQRDVRMVATGWSYTCALHRSGKVDCWGANFAGELGCASPTVSNGGAFCTPYPAGSPIAQVVAGAQRGCVRKHDGKVECWGRNDHFDLGDGSNLSTPTPTLVSGLSDATVIASGVWQGCAVSANSRLDCWGPNDRAQLGNGTLLTMPLPTTVSDLDGVSAKVVAVSPAEDHSCALLVGGSVRCFGENLYGQLGNRQIADYSTTPVPCGFSRPVTLIAAGIGFTCAALDDTSVECLGRGDLGQLGNNATIVSLTPVKVAFPTGTVLQSIAVKYDHVCALDQHGHIFCWGSNSAGQLGNGTTVDSDVPSLVRDPGES